MNPIFTLSIDLEKRKISATGLVAVGEKVDVVVKGVDYSSIPVWETDNTEGFIGPALRFRLVTPEGKDLVRFPLAKGDAWNKNGDSLSAEVDFNTMQLRDWLRGFPIAEKAEVGIIIDSVVDAMEYGRGTVKILQWVASPAEDPTILPDWRKTLRELNAAIVEISYKSEQAVNAATLAEYAKELARKYADSASIAANNALKSENEAKRFRNESLTAAQSASESANDASGARTAAESAKVAAETARDEAREHAESAKVELQAEVERATMAEKKNAAAIDETGKALVVETERAKAAEQNLANEFSEVGGKINTIIADDAGKSARTIAAEEVAKVVADAPADFDTLKEIAEYIESDKTGAAQMVTKIDDNANAISAEAQRAQEAEAALRRTVDGKVDAEAGKGLSSNDYTNEDKEKLGTAYTPDNPPPAPDLSGYATKVAVELVQGSVDSLWSAYESVNNKADAALPRYLFTSAGIIDGVVTIPPYVYASMLSDGMAFTVAVGEDDIYMRDCILIVECGDVAPTITWPANFHPRTDAETDFACVAGVNKVHVNNVYWISEYVQGEFVVAGWQATAGGSAA